MAERILFLTGHLARPRLEKVLARIEDAGFDWSIFDVGVKVAALMTEAIISRRVPRPVQADRIWYPVAAAPTSTASAPTSAFGSSEGQRN